MFGVSYVRFSTSQLWSDQIRQCYYYCLADDCQHFIFCCSSTVPRQHFITCHSWFDWKAFQNQLISKSHVFVVSQIIWNNNARHNQKSRWILQSTLRITWLKHSWEFPGFAVNFILVGPFAGKASKPLWPQSSLWRMCSLPGIQVKKPTMVNFLTE